MILRKPYAFLIKHFKLLHIILAFINFYIIKHTFSLAKFFVSYMNTSEVLYYENYSSQLFNRWMFILPILMVLVVLVVLLVLVRKKKPTIFYFLVIFMAATIVVLYNISLSTVVKMETEIIDSQKIGLIRDFLFFSIILQAYTLLVNSIRGIGFDVKKFDFGKDLQELETTSADNEEVEISIQVDTNKVDRRFRRTRRFARYNYIEHQLLYNCIFVIVGIVFISTTLYLIFRKDDTYHIYDTFTTENYMVTLKNAYVTSNDYKGNTIDKDKKFIIVEAEVSSLLEDKVLDSRNLQLVLNDHSFYHISKYKEEFFDLGVVYTGEKITTNVSTYLFMFEIDSYYDTNKLTFRFAENYQDAKERLKNNYVDVGITTINLDNVDTISKNLNEELVIDNTIFKGTTLNISSLNIAKRFKINYKKKISRNEYYDSFEYIVPNIDENYDKALLNINGKVELKSINSGVYRFETFMSKFGRIVYQIDDKDYIYEFKNSNITSDKVNLNDIYYLEIKKEILSSNKVYLEIKLRNKVYRYKIK